MGLLTCLAISFVLMIGILAICKWYKFSIIPRGMQLKAPSKYRWPKVTRGKYGWEEDKSEYLSFSDSDSDDYTSSDESETSDDEWYF